MITEKLLSKFKSVKQKAYKKHEDKGIIHLIFCNKGEKYNKMVLSHLEDYLDKKKIDRIGLLQIIIQLKEGLKDNFALWAQFSVLLLISLLPQLMFPFFSLPIGSGVDGGLKEWIEIGDQLRIMVVMIVFAIFFVVFFLYLGLSAFKDTRKSLITYLEEIYFRKQK